MPFIALLDGGIFCFMGTLQGSHAKNGWQLNHLFLNKLVLDLKGKASEGNFIVKLNYQNVHC